MLVEGAAPLRGLRAQQSAVKRDQHPKQWRETLGRQASGISRPTVTEAFPGQQAPQDPLVALRERNRRRSTAVQGRPPRDQVILMSGSITPS